MQERIVHLGDVQLSIAEAGVGQRPFLLLHGFCGAKEDFTEWLDPLASAGWHAVAPDHRGHGASSKPASEADYSFEIFADDALALVEALGWERFALLGHSMGGMIAQVVAGRVPERLEALILMDTTFRTIKGLDPQLVQGAVSIVRTQGVDALADLLAKAGGVLDTPAHQRLVAERPGYAEWGDRKLRATSPALYGAMAPRFVDMADHLDDLRKLPPSLPSLVLVGDQDKPFLKSSEQMTEALADATLAIIPDAGHSPQFENPDAWWSAVSGFLANRVAVPD